MCTRVVYQGTNATILTGRSMDWKEECRSNLWIFPRGMDRSGEAGNNPVLWKSKYGSVIASAYDICSTDGMNERGLVANLLWLAESSYPKWSGTKPGLTIAAWVQYVLDNYATVSEAVDDLSQEKFEVVSSLMPDGSRFATLHLAISDATGDSAIFEYLGGKLTYLLLVGAGDHNAVGVGNVDGDAVHLGNDNLMGETEVHDKVLALLCGTVTDALNFKSLGVAVGHALDHVGDEGSGQTVKRAVFLCVVGTGYDNFVTLDLGFDFAGDGVMKSALGALNGHFLAVDDAAFAHRQHGRYLLLLLRGRGQHDAALGLFVSVIHLDDYFVK